MPEAELARVDECDRSIPRRETIRGTHWQKTPFGCLDLASRNPSWQRSCATATTDLTYDRKRSDSHEQTLATRGPSTYGSRLKAGTTRREACERPHFAAWLPLAPPTTTPAAFSIGLIADVKSDSGPMSRITTSQSRPTASATSIDSPSCFISSSARRTSFTIKPVAKPKSKVRGSTARGNLSRLAVFMPEPELITSIITAGSSPDLTPITTASDVATIAGADRKLLASFMV